MKKFVKFLWRANVPRLKPRVVRVLAHDPEAFTQGLAYHEGLLYESTGGIGHSTVRCLDSNNGKVIFQRPVPDSNSWGEGLAISGDRLVQLTWRQEKAFVYSFPDLEFAGEISFSGEGWGLSSGEGLLLLSNGTNRVFFLDGDLVEQRSIRVTLRGLPVKRLNDLEWVDDMIYANVWYSPEIMVVRAQNGNVLSICDCREIVAMEKTRDTEAVLNGIAHNPDHDTFFITGKRWQGVYEVAFVPFS